MYKGGWGWHDEAALMLCPIPRQEKFIFNSLTEVGGMVTTQRLVSAHADLDKLLQSSLKWMVNKLENSQTRTQLALIRD